MMDLYSAPLCDRLSRRYIDDEGAAVIFQRAHSFTELFTPCQWWYALEQESLVGAQILVWPGYF